MKSFSDFCDEIKPLEGDKMRLDDAINIALVVTGHKIVQSKFKEAKCLHLEVEIDGVKRVIFTGSTILIEQIEKYHSEIPFSTTIIKNKRYYTFT